MSTRTLAGALTAVTILALPASSPAQKAMELTALDYIQIQQLVAKYARAIDTCSNNGYDYADLYTPDGVFLPVVNGKPVPGIQGREKLAEVSGGGSKGCKNVPWIEQGVQHIYVNHIITPTPEGATGTVDMMMIGLDGDPNKIESDGYYEDVYVKTAQGWRFKQRTHHALLDAGRRVAPPTAPAGDPPSSGSAR
jgi:ketosteroid isomerase-like protein